MGPIMRRENIDGVEFALLTPEENAKMRKAWEELGGTCDDAGDGVVLYMASDSVQFRVRVDQVS